jgi:hypothetical protein
MKSCGINGENGPMPASLFLKNQAKIQRNSLTDFSQRTIHNL